MEGMGSTFLAGAGMMRTRPLRDHRSTESSQRRLMREGRVGSSCGKSVQPNDSSPDNNIERGCRIAALEHSVARACPHAIETQSDETPYQR
jgi:hypothetical protein